MELDRLRLVLMTTSTTTAFPKWHEMEAKTAQTQVTNVASSPPTITRSRGVRFAPPLVDPTAYTDPGTGSSSRPSSKISNICHAIYGCAIPNGQGVPIGHLSDGQYTHDFQILKADAGNLELLSLEELLLASLSATETFRAPLIFPKRERRFLAAKLASTFLECHGNWLPSRWSSRNIFFTKNITSTNLEKTIRTPVLARKLSNPTEFEGYKLPWTAFNDVLFPLGLALIELSLCRTITCLHPPSDPGQDEISTLLEKARTWIYDVTCESGTQYGDAVQQCLFWTKSREVDMESEEFQAAVFQYIVKPLVEDFDQFKDL
ncbi:uncharacterized protein N7473_004868 [Penicillium subrubescens]|jgi:hypothetical protein|uniref:uncharacterized protein n=1 Tax=Penicillium subrubescens TaxID=1316194 RepID=UPI002545766E|nr:uncharacterized protein N7473_004868 [Penicillium subrubescens]KAJ5900798.1 hypothetical protein N7473_004868 [Penicillium subrubescens]